MELGTGYMGLPMPTMRGFNSKAEAIQFAIELLQAHQWVVARSNSKQPKSFTTLSARMWSYPMCALTQPMAWWSLQRSISRSWLRLKMMYKLKYQTRGRIESYIAMTTSFISELAGGGGLSQDTSC